MKKTIAIALLVTAAAQATPLFNACKGCHGQMAENSALGKSKIINTMSKKDIMTALHGYKTGTYGGTMKAVMRGQVARLSDADIKTLADYIVTLKK